MAIAPGEGISQAEATAATIAGQKAAAARNATTDSAASAESKTTPAERARESGQSYGSSNVGNPAGTAPVAPTPPAGDKTLVDKVDNGDGTFTLVYSDNSQELLGTKKTTGETTTPVRTYAKDTFINTLKLTFGAQEASQPYVSKLYDLVSGFYKSGSTEDEALNLAIRAAKDENAIPEFTDRFKGIFALQDKLRAGEAVVVPTIAEFFAAEAKMGEVLQNAGLGDLANQSFLGDIIGKGKSVLEVGNLISNVFDTIDNAPTALKTDLQTYFPGVDRSSIAKAILTGPEGAAALANKIKGISVQSAASSQGLNVDLASAQNLANMGYDYNQALAGFGQVAAESPTYQKLSQISNQGPMSQAQAQANVTGAVLGKSASEQRKLKQLAEQEAGRFAGSSGTSKGAFSTGYLAKESGAGQF